MSYNSQFLSEVSFLSPFRMPEIASFVFFDIETTGLPFQENNETKIIEFSFIATLRKHLEITPYSQMPPVKKMTFVLNPRRPICKEVIKMTGISKKELANAPTFQEKVNHILSFLEQLPNPVCLVAHNGNAFDYKILLAELNDASACLPLNLFCVDSLVGFRRILANSGINHSNLEHPIPTSTEDDLITDDEDEWPDLNLSTEEWDAIDSLSCLSESEAPKKNKKKRSAAIKKVFKKGANDNTDKECFKLTAVYKRLMNKEEENAHRAEVDCIMLLQCVVALKKDFLPWADNNCKLLTEIQPLIRGVSSRKRYYRMSR